LLRLGEINNQSSLRRKIKDKNQRACPAEVRTTDTRGTVGDGAHRTRVLKKGNADVKELVNKRKHDIRLKFRQRAQTRRTTSRDNLEWKAKGRMGRPLNHHRHLKGRLTGDGKKGPMRVPLFRRGEQKWRGEKRPGDMRERGKKNSRKKLQGWGSRLSKRVKSTKKGGAQGRADVS